MKKKDKNVRTGSKKKSVGVKKTNVSYSGTPSKSVLQKIAGKMQQSKKRTDSDCKDCMNWCACVEPDCDILCSCVCSSCSDCACSCECNPQCLCTYCQSSARAKDYPSQASVKNKFGDIEEILNRIPRKAEIPTKPSKRKKRKHS